MVSYSEKISLGFRRVPIPDLYNTGSRTWKNSGLWYTYRLWDLKNSEVFRLYTWTLGQEFWTSGYLQALGLRKSLGSGLHIRARNFPQSQSPYGGGEIRIFPSPGGYKAGSIPSDFPHISSYSFILSTYFLHTFSYFPHFRLMISYFLHIISSYFPHTPSYFPYTYFFPKPI